MLRASSEFQTGLIWFYVGLGNVVGKHKPRSLEKLSLWALQAFRIQGLLGFRFEGVSLRACLYTFSAVSGLSVWLMKGSQFTSARVS